MPLYPQPDRAEVPDQAKSCQSVLGPKPHDTKCSERQPPVCEESDCNFYWNDHSCCMRWRRMHSSATSVKIPRIGKSNTAEGPRAILRPGPRSRTKVLNR
jgi:hypothetical protein